MSDLSKFSESELKGVLKMTKILAEQVVSNEEKATAQFLAMNDEEIQDDAERRGKTIASRRNTGRGGRVLVDDPNDAEQIQIRKMVQDRLRRKGFYDEKTVKD